MNEMTPSERVALNTLRATALAKMSDEDFANLEDEVARKGLRNLDGWFGAQVAKAVDVVLKHPGHADQSVHGGGKGKGGGSSSAPAPSAGGAPNIEAGKALVAQFKNEKQKALDARRKGKVATYEQVHDNTRRHGKMTGAQMIVNRAKTREEATAELGKIKAQINNKQSQIRISELLGQEEGAQMAIDAIFGS